MSNESWSSNGSAGPPIITNPNEAMDDYSYTVGQLNQVLRHDRLIDRGGFGEVHEV